MKEHQLKTDPQAFDDVVAGRKSFEIRIDDRGFEVGDVLLLRKTKHTGDEMKAGSPLEYIGPPLFAYITYILPGPIYGLAKNWVIMSIKPRDTANSMNRRHDDSDNPAFLRRQTE